MFFDTPRVHWRLPGHAVNLRYVVLLNSRLCLGTRLEHMSVRFLETDGGSLSFFRVFQRSYAGNALLQGRHTISQSAASSSSPNCLQEQGGFRGTRIDLWDTRGRGKAEENRTLGLKSVCRRLLGVCRL